MRVVGLALTNIKRHQGTVVFEKMADGVLLLLGRNGRGKSTVPQALSLAVFGNRPKPFRGRGTGLVGFVNRQCSSGEIRAVVEFPRKPRTLTFVVKLEVGKVTASGEPSNILRHSIYEGAEPLEGELSIERQLHDNMTLEALQGFIKDELNLPLQADKLCESLLSPPQTGGLTSYFTLTDKERKDRTEEMLGLHAVRSVVAALKRMYLDTQSGSRRLAKQFHESLEKSVAEVPALSGVRKRHGKGKSAYDGLDIGELRAAFNETRAARVREAAVENVALVEAIGRVEDAHAFWTRCSDRSKALNQVVQAQERLGRARQELARSERAVQRRDALAPQAKEWQEASEAVDLCVRQERTRTEERRALETRRTEAEKFLEGVAGREEGRAIRLKSIETAAAADAEELREVQEGMQDWEHRASHAKATLERASGTLVDIGVLIELHASITGVGGMKDVASKLSQVQEAVQSERLPVFVQELVTHIADQLGQSERLTSGQDGGWAIKLAEVKAGAQRGRTQAQDAVNALGGEKAGADRQIAAFRRAEDQRALQRKRVAEEAEKEGDRQRSSQAALKSVGEDQLALEERYRDLDVRREAAQAIKDDPERKSAYDQWRVAQGEAAHLDRHQQTVASGLEALQIAVDVVEDASVAIEDTEAWAGLARKAELAVQDARSAVQTANQAQTQAHAALQLRIRGMRELDRLEDQLVEELRTLMSDRAQERELEVFFNQVVQRIPTTIAGRVVGQVSSMANEFFQQVYIQAAEPTELVWDPETYAVSMRRESGVIPARHASGGEKMALGIALNLAVLHFMAPAVRWLVLDEPTASLDEENRAGLRDFVETLREPVIGGQTLFDQLLFISHESKLFEGLGDAIIFGDEGPE